jgi:hypothetical protein
MTDAVTLKPGAVGGAPADIVVSIIWRSITKVNVVDQTFDAEINIKSTAHRGVEVLDPTFRGPELKVMNAAAIEVINTPAWQVKQNGDLVEEVQVRGKFTSHFDMENFPLDTQELSVIIQVRSIAPSLPRLRRPDLEHIHFNQLTHAHARSSAHTHARTL